MPIVPKGTAVTAIPWNIPAANWKLPGDKEWFNGDAWLPLLNWQTKQYDPVGLQLVWWQVLEKITKDDYQFSIAESVPWHGDDHTNEHRYSFVYLKAGTDAEFAGFVVENCYLIVANYKEWRYRWQSTEAQEESYLVLLHTHKKIQAIKQYRDDHGLCPLRTAKDAIDDLNGLQLLERTLKP